MMRRRFILNANTGVFVDRNGEPMAGVVGRVVGITMEVEEGKGGRGDEMVSSPLTSSSTDVGKTTNLTGGVGGQEPDPVSEVWEHYVKVFAATRMKLDEPRRRIIRNALKVRSVAECCKAIDGLYVSPFHNGDNDRRTKYLGIAYALKGRNGESHDERIDKMAELAPVNAGSSTIDPVKIERRLEAIRLNVRNAAFEPERAKEAKRQLEEWGFIVTTMKDPPFVELSRVAR